MFSIVFYFVFVVVVVVFFFLMFFNGPTWMDGQWSRLSITRAR